MHTKFPISTYNLEVICFIILKISMPCKMIRDLCTISWSIWYVTYLIVLQKPISWPYFYFNLELNHFSLQDFICSYLRRKVWKAIQKLSDWCNQDIKPLAPCIRWVSTPDCPNIQNLFAFSVTFNFQCLLKL